MGKYIVIQKKQFPLYHVRKVKASCKLVIAFCLPDMMGSYYAANIICETDKETSIIKFVRECKRLNEAFLAHHPAP